MMRSCSSELTPSSADSIRAVISCSCAARASAAIPSWVCGSKRVSKSVTMSAAISWLSTSAA